MAQSSNRFCSNCGEELEQSANFCAPCGTATSSQERPGASSQGGAQSPAPGRPVTLGIYALYWFYVTLGELHKANGNSEGSGLWTVLSLIPFIQYFAYWHYSNEYTEFVNEKYSAIAIFLLWVIFSPAVWFLVQSDLNGAANREEDFGSMSR